MSTQGPWIESAQQIQHFWTEQWGKALQAWPLPGAPAMAGAGSVVQMDTEKLQALQQNYVQQAMQLWSSGTEVPEAALKDKRFRAPAWRESPVSALTAASYLLQSQALMGMADAVQGDAKTRERIRFAVEQWVAAMSPSNFLALNPEAQQKMLQTNGESLRSGIQNLLKDLVQGHVSMTDESQFEVGVNVATTEGAVVYENELFQLLEYKPLTAKVHQKPLLMVPPCINKFYIMDLQPENSLIRYAVAQGHRTFVISWRNPDASLAQKTWDDYIGDAVLHAIAVVQDLCNAPQINALGFCVGGTMLATALAVLAARGEQPVGSATFLTTLMDFSDTGVLDIFIDEALVRLREVQMGQGGLLKGQELGATFSFLRPNELVWNYVVGNYLKGETPPPFDLLYWNSDSTNLPGPWYTWYLRNTYLENNLIRPGHATVCGEAVDLHNIEVPAYVYGSREDHIVPIGGAYAATQVLGGDVRFVMGASGHIAGVINPPSAGKRSHWTGPEGAPAPTLQEWLQGSQEHAGSWWDDWAQWLAGQAGPMVAAPKRYGRGTVYQAIEPAPGRYVKAKA